MILKSYKKFNKNTEIILIEDNCESMGATFEGKKLEHSV